MDRRNGVGTLSCRICRVSFQSAIAWLDMPVDVYSLWIDRCHEEHEKSTAATTTMSAVSSQQQRRAPPAREGSLDEEYELMDEVPDRTGASRIQGGRTREEDERESPTEDFLTNSPREEEEGPGAGEPETSSGFQDARNAEKDQEDFGNKAFLTGEKRRRLLKGRAGGSSSDDD